jgi:hypothetical protein
MDKPVLSMTLDTNFGSAGVILRDATVINGGHGMYYRVLVGSTGVKYLILTDTKEVDDFPYFTFNRIKLDKLPDGDWNVARFGYNEMDDTFVFQSAETRELLDTVHAGSGVRIDLESMGEPVPHTEEEELQMDGVDAGQCHVFLAPAIVGVPRVLVFSDPFYHLHPEPPYRESLETEVAIRRLDRDQGFTTRLLGYVTESGGRVIGIMLESVSVRRAGIKDLKACQAAVQMLHRLGFAYHRLRRENFLVVKGGEQVLLQRFNALSKTNNRRLLAKEMADIGAVLKEPWDSPGVVDSELEKLGYHNDFGKRLHKIWTRDKGIHPVIGWEVVSQKKITITKKEHWTLLEYWRIMKWRWTDKDMEHALECRRRNGRRWLPWRCRNGRKATPTCLLTTFADTTSLRGSGHQF